MKIRYRSDDDDLREFRRYDQSPNRYADYEGVCGCGTVTKSYLTVGPEGHPENGWTCKACQENRLRWEMQKANGDPRRI